MRKAIPCVFMLVGALIAPRGISAWNTFSFTVVPFDFDPYRTHLVEAEWEDGIGCPTNAWTTPDGTTFIGYTDGACTSGDPNDRRNFGLLLVKTGPTSNFASAGATINGVKGMALTELGYDLRKPAIFDPSGSHCGAGAPRFDVVTSDDVDHFVGCASPPGLQTATGNGWIRLRWTTAQLLAAFPPILPTDTVKSLEIVFDEGQDPSGGPDFFGAAILDNIDVNGTLVGRGPDKPEERDRDECEGEDKDHRHFHGHSSSSRPETSGMSFYDPSGGTKVQMVNGATGITYSGTCSTMTGDALLNDVPGYSLTFTACDLSALSTPLLPKIGNYTVVVTGASGVVYQKSGALTSGFVSIHPH